MAAAAGYDFELMRAVLSSNDEQTARMVRHVTALAGGRLRGVHVAAWAWPSRPAPTTRGSRRLRRDPPPPRSRRHRFGLRPRRQAGAAARRAAGSALEAAADAQVLVVLTEWPEFAAVPPAEVAKRLAARSLLDTRRIIDAQAYAKLGFAVHVVGLGR